jgi:hypothetical protein
MREYLSELMACQYPLELNPAYVPETWVLRNQDHLCDHYVLNTDDDQVRSIPDGGKDFALGLVRWALQDWHVSRLAQNIALE